MVHHVSMDKYWYTSPIFVNDTCNRVLMAGFYSICRSIQLHGRDDFLPPLQTHASTLG